MANWVHFPIQTDDGGEVWVTMDNDAPDFLEKLDKLRDDINRNIAEAKSRRCSQDKT